MSAEITAELLASVYLQICSTSPEVERRGPPLQSIRAGHVYLPAAGESEDTHMVDKDGDTHTSAPLARGVQNRGYNHDREFRQLLFTLSITHNSRLRLHANPRVGMLEGVEYAIGGH